MNLLDVNLVLKGLKFIPTNPRSPGRRDAAMKWGIRPGVGIFRGKFRLSSS